MTTLLSSAQERRSTLRSRLAVSAAATTAVALFLAGVLGVRLTSTRLRNEVDASLKSEANRLATAISSGIKGGGTGSSDRAAAITELAAGAGLRTAFRLFDGQGEVFDMSGFEAVGVDMAMVKVALRQTPPLLRTRTFSKNSIRTYVLPVGDELALEVGRYTDDIDRTVQGLTYDFVLLGLLGTLTAVAIGASVAQRALRPAATLAAAAHQVAASRDPGLHVPAQGGAELATVANAINTMLRSLDDERRKQQRLIDDAAHELRTPLTSMRTNIELLTEDRITDPQDKKDLLADVTAQMEEFSTLVTDLGELSRGQQTSAEFAPVNLASVVQSAVDRASLRASTPIRVVLETGNDALVNANTLLLQRAIVNVIDNALKFSPDNQPVEIRVNGGLVETADKGVGLSDGDLAFMFEPFWRSANARGVAGSGLGLAIVRDIVNRHNGSVSALANPGGGTIIRIEIPLLT